MTTYSRYATCSEGHRIVASFAWDPDSMEAATEYLRPCPVSGCHGQVEGKLPVGGDFGTLRLEQAQAG